MEKNRLVALYTRVSSTKQVEDGYSLEAQEQVLRDEVSRQGKLVFKVYTDAGVSGADTNRSGLLALISDAKRGLFGSVGVWTISRISRNLPYFLWVLDELKSANVNFFSISEKFDYDTAIGKFAIQMMGGIAQMQRESWRENSMLGSMLRVKGGKFAGGSMLGYKLVPDKDDIKGGNIMVVDPSEAVVVRKIFDLYCSGMGFKAIAHKLNNEGHTGKNGIAFSINTVRGILTNRAYIGYVKYGGEYYMGVHEPIIEVEQWETVQNILADRKQYKKSIDYNFLLAGLVKCPECGAGMIPWHTTLKNKNGSIRTYYYYTCGKYLNTGFCRANVVKAKETDAAVLHFMCNYLSSKQWQDKVIAEINRRCSIDEAALLDVNKFKSKIVKLKQQKTDLLLKYEEGNIDKQELLDRMKALQEEIGSNELMLYQHNANIAKPSFSEEDIRNVFNNLTAVVEAASDAEKIKLIKSLIKAVYVDAHRTVSSIEVYVPCINTDTLMVDIKEGGG